MADWIISEFMWFMYTTRCEFEERRCASLSTLVTLMLYRILTKKSTSAWVKFFLCLLVEETSMTQHNWTHFSHLTTLANVCIKRICLRCVWRVSGRAPRRPLRLVLGAGLLLSHAIRPLVTERTRCDTICPEIWTTTPSSHFALMKACAFFCVCIFLYR